VSGQRKIVVLVGVLAVLWAIGQAKGDPVDPGTPDRPSAASTNPPPERSPSPTATRSPVASSDRPSATPDPVVASPGTALAALAHLAVKGRAPMTGYAREEFGQAWLDADRNGCDTRNDILGRDVAHRVYQPGTGGCVVLSGVLHDPYLGRDVPFERGAGDQVDIDHVVPLGNAWVTGAARQDIHVRAALANDPLNLLAVDLHTNREKGDGDAATWLPPYRPFRCAYVARQIAVKQKYGLWVTVPERAAMQRILAGCPDQALPADPTHAPTRVDQNITDPAAAPSSSTGPRGLVGGTSVYYENCDAVRAAGAAPIHAGDPGYSRKLDRDGDGVGCE
jgi:hypothetical protein